MRVAELPQALERYKARALHLVPSRDGAPFSRLGGLPQLAPGLEWPEWEGASLAFLAQVALAELPAPSPVLGSLREGALYFFYDQGQSTWGFDPKDRGSWRVLFSPSLPKVRPTPRPEDVPAESVFGEKPLVAKEIDTYPGSGRFGLFNEDPWEDVLKALEHERQVQSAPFGGLPRHQLGGYPTPEQSDEMELECQLASNGIYQGDASGREDPRVAKLAEGARDWELLLQVDTDDDVRMMWGDAGRLYFWIRSQDLARRDFSNVWMILQCG